MKTYQQIDRSARDLDPEVRHSNFMGAKLKSERRYAALERDYEDPDQLRQTAGLIKQHTLEHLDTYLEQAERSFQSKGVHVHFAFDDEALNARVLDIMNDNGAQSLVKSKSMLTEETHLLDYLEKKGKEVVETDLGEFILQLDHDHPSHIVTPIVHKNRRGIAETFEREHIGPDYNDDPATITRRARTYLRQKYLDADVGLTGANFVSAESGRIVLVTNEGNARFCMAANKIHIAVVGIEKLVPTDRDLGLFINLIGRSGTGQQLTVYNQFVGGPKAEGRPHGPEQMHVIFVDNRRTEVLASDCREILRCIRCGACLNVCPIYRQSGGHAYRRVSPGPVGAVLSPLLAGNRFPELADLPKASSLCGACNEVCPVDIPIPDLLLRLRDKAKREGAKEAMKGTPNLALWATLCSQPALWKTALSMGHTMNYIPTEMIPHPSARAWQGTRKLPKFEGGEFRKWFKKRDRPSRDEHPAPNR